MNTPYPTLNFDLGEDIDMLRNSVYQFCQKEIAPRASEIDEKNEFPAGRLLRDAKLFEIGAPTSEIRRMLIGRELFNETR